MKTINPKENDVTVVNSAFGHCVTASSTNTSLSLATNSSNAVEADENGANIHFVSHCSWLMYVY